MGRCQTLPPTRSRRGKRTPGALKNAHPVLADRRGHPVRKTKARRDGTSRCGSWCPRPNAARSRPVGRVNARAPRAAVVREPCDIRGQDDADLPPRHMAHQGVEALTVMGTRRAVAALAVDALHGLRGPASRWRACGQGVLEPEAFLRAQRLVRGRLAHGDHRGAGQRRGRDAVGAVQRCAPGRGPRVRRGSRRGGRGCGRARGLGGRRAAPLAGLGTSDQCWDGVRGECRGHAGKRREERGHGARDAPHHTSLRERAYVRGGRRLGARRPPGEAASKQRMGRIRNLNLGQGILWEGPWGIESGMTMCARSTPSPMRGDSGGWRRAVMTAH